MILDHHITVAEAAAVINVAIIIVQVTYPLFVTLVAVGILKRQTNAATWSVFGRLIHRSYWSRILRTDATSGTKVDKRIRLFSIFSSLIGVLLAIAAAITPLGLHSALRLQESDLTPFTYVKDESPIGRGSQSRDAYSSNRVCSGLHLVVSCPGNDDGVTFYSNSTGEGYSTPDGSTAHVTSGISSNITSLFTSATGKEKSTIASYFDIQYRSYIDYNNQTKPDENRYPEWIDEGRPRTQGQFRYYQGFILEDSYHAIDGLVVSTTENPGIGFRNHTLPPSSDLGYTWTEDLLWLEPETVCTNLNLTYDYTIAAPDDFSSWPPNARITDRGGLINLPRDYPYLDLNNTQDNPQLLSRSWKGAVITNEILVKFMNETRANFRLGKTYPIENITSTPGISRSAPNQVVFSNFGSADASRDQYNPSLPGQLSFLSRTGNTTSLLSSNNGFTVDTTVRGYGGLDPLNITTAAAIGGLMLGAGTMVDKNGNPTNNSGGMGLNPGTDWSQPLFSCVSGVLASIKTVQFKVNGTSSISNLVVENVSSKTYASKDTLPVWAMEYPGGNIGDLSPFWGIIAPEKRDQAGIQTLQREDFRLPAGSGSIIASLNSDDANAGYYAPFAALKAAYENSNGDSSLGIPDLSGAGSWLLYNKWASLGSDSKTAGKIIDYMWTDLMANSVVSSKSLLSTSNPNNTLSEANVPASHYVQSIRYDWRYAIPALIFGAIYSVLVLGSMLLFCTRALSISILRFMLNQTAAGRSMTTERSLASMQADFGKTKEWARARGDEMVRVGKDYNQPMHAAPQGQYGYYPLQDKQGVQASTQALVR